MENSVYVAYVALVIAAAAAYWMAAPPTYEVSAIISVKPGLYGVETATLRADQNARSQVALLESEDVIRQTIGAIGAAELYPNQEVRGNLMVIVRQYYRCRRRGRAISQSRSRRLLDR